MAGGGIVTADLLREAAAKMRERAEAATPGPWHVCEGDEHEGDWADERVSGPGHEPIAALDSADYESDPDEPSAENDAVHIASWHPAVALAVADWLDRAADLYAANPYDDRFPGSETARALAIARAYLGRTA